MSKRLAVRTVAEEERLAVKRLAHARRAPARAVERAQVVERTLDGKPVEQIAADLGLARNTVYLWWYRFERLGLAGLALSRLYAA
ncbi:MAG TPA: helix-turn-helix domain-containing protein [Ktedonobacterales bacterium]